VTAREMTRCRAQYSPESPECGVPMPCLTHYPDPPVRPEQPSLADGLDRHRFGPGGMLILGLLLALTVGAGSARAGERTKAVAVWCSAKAADLATTEMALSRGGHESNPLMRDRGVRIGAGVASCVVAAEADHKLRKHRKSRWAVRILGLGLMAYAVQNNARVSR
jgi:hypothetical protein